ncbi:MAG: AMP-binding protein [Syntrophorhabdales bacterium]|jgi:acyl-CoA synthetase (AMP-forming)/AMP-acid ligase II
MEKRWHKVWPVLVPKDINVEKPVSEYIRDWASLTPDHIALTYYGTDITYKELNRLIDKTAWGLIGSGVKRGDRVAIHMQNCPQFVLSYFGAHRAGAVAVPLNPMFKHSELEYELNDCGAETLIGEDTLYAEIKKIRTGTSLSTVVLSSLGDFLPERPALPFPAEEKTKGNSFPDSIPFLEFIDKSKDEPICNVASMKEDLALLQYTGGTTGMPKGAMISHHALCCASVGSAFWFRLRDDDVSLGVTPFFHTMGQQVTMAAPLLAGARLILLVRFVPNVVAQAVHLYRCTFWVGAPTMFTALINMPDVANYDFSSFKVLVTGGAEVSPTLQSEIRGLAPRSTLFEGYGLTECLPQGGIVTPAYRNKTGFIGIPQHELKIVDVETGMREMPANEEGEIAVKAPTMMEGYWNKPEETEKVLRNHWLFTGDIGVMDEDGYVKVLGRNKEMIKCSGFSVFPAEVEPLLQMHPAVREAAVIGVRDAYRGETPKAFITLKPGYPGKVTEGEILEWSKQNMAAYKAPRMIEFRADLPKSAAGKLLHRILAEEERAKGAQIS